MLVRGRFVKSCEQNVSHPLSEGVSEGVSVEDVQRSPRQAAGQWLKVVSE